MLENILLRSSIRTWSLSINHDAAGERRERWRSSRIRITECRRGGWRLVSESWPNLVSSKAGQSSVYRQERVLLYSFRTKYVWVWNKDFFFLQCRTSTRHGRSTTGICIDCDQISLGAKPKTKTPTQTTKHNRKNQHPHKSQAPGQANQPGKFVN